MPYSCFGTVLPWPNLLAHPYASPSAGTIIHKFLINSDLWAYFPAPLCSCMSTWLFWGATFPVVFHGRALGTSAGRTASGLGMLQPLCHFLLLAGMREVESSRGWPAILSRKGRKRDLKGFVWSNLSSLRALKCSMHLKNANWNLTANNILTNSVLLEQWFLVLNNNSKHLLEYIFPLFVLVLEYWCSCHRTNLVHFHLFKCFSSSTMVISEVYSKYGH